MLNISKQQALQRWEVLPDSLREALFSEYNADTLWKICQDQHLPEDKIKKAALLLGDVILGFEHLDDLAKDIALETGINQQIANSIVQEIDRKILLPIKSDIEKNYKPATPELLPTRQPIIETKPMERLAETPVAAPKPFSPLDILKEVPAAPKPQAPVAEIPVSKPIIPSIVPVVSKENSVVSPAAPTGPLIIHKEAEFKPLSESKKSLGGFFSFLNKGTEKKEIKDVVSPVRAKVEINPFFASSDANALADKKAMEGKPSFIKIPEGKPESKPSPVKASENKPVEPSKVKVVHYSDISSSTPINPFSPGFSPAISPMVPKAPDAAPKPTLKDLSKPIVPIEPSPSFAAKPPVSSVPVVPVIPVASEKPKEPIPVVPIKEKSPEAPANANKENVIDLRSFK